MVVRSVFKEEVCDQIRVVELKDVAAKRLVVIKVTILPGVPEHEVRGVLAEGATGEDARKQRRTGRVAGASRGMEMEWRRADG